MHVRKCSLQIVDYLQINVYFLFHIESNVHESYFTTVTRELGDYNQRVI